MPKNPRTKPPAKKHKHAKGCCAQDPVESAADTLAHYHLHHTDDMITRLTGDLDAPDIYVVSDPDWKLKLRQATAETVNAQAHRGSNAPVIPPETEPIIAQLNQTITGLAQIRDLAATQGMTKEKFAQLFLPVFRATAQLIEEQCAQHAAAPPTTGAVQ